MPRHSDAFQCQVGIQSGMKCLRFNSLDGSNEDRITEEITVSISYCADDSWLTVYDIIHAGTEVYVLRCFIWLYPGGLKSMVLSLISFIFLLRLSSFYLSCFYCGTKRQEASHPVTMKLDSGRLNEIFSLSCSSSRISWP